MIEADLDSTEGYLLIFSNISAKIQKARLALFNSYKNEIYAFLSHNLKTPLNALILYT